MQKSSTPDGLLASLTDANNHATGFAYDGFDRLATTTYPLGSTEVLTYDADSNVLTRKTRANQTIGFAYDTLNRLITKTPPSPAPVVSYRYDLAGRLMGVSDTSAAIAAAVPPSGPSVQYGTTAAYDALNRPTGISWNPAPTAAVPTASGVSFGHAYNKANQRIGQTATDNSWLNYPAASQSTVSYTADALNRYTAVGGVAPTYDGNSNLTSDGTFTLGYDAENRLISAVGAGNTAAYAYDAQGRRKTRTVNGTTTVFVTDASNREVLEYDGTTGAIQRWYAYGLGSNEVLNQMNIVAATRATLIPDIQGSVIASIDSSSGALSKIGYPPYGKSGSAGPFGYTGQRIDTETNGLYYYRARHYSPAWGRFLQTDPIGYNGGNHLYAYVGNDPLNGSDPTGLDTQIMIGYTHTPLPGSYHQVVILTDTVTGQQYATRAGPTAQSFSDYFTKGFGPIHAQAGVYGPTFRDPPSSVVATQQVGTIPTDYSQSVANAINFANVTNNNAIPYSTEGPNSNSYASTFVQSLTGTRPTPILNAPAWEMGTPSANLSYSPSPLSGSGDVSISSGTATGSLQSTSTGNSSASYGSTAK